MLIRLLFNWFRRPGRAGRQGWLRSGVRVNRTVTVRSWGYDRHLDGAVFRGRGYIIDGDTLRIGKVRVRLAGVDAPELDQPWGNKAKWALVEMCKGQMITVKATGETSHNRIVAFCYLPNGTDIGAEMVRLGHALDFTPLSRGKYRHLEPIYARRKFYGLHCGQEMFLRRMNVNSSSTEHPF